MQSAFGALDPSASLFAQDVALPSRVFLKLSTKLTTVLTLNLPMSQVAPKFMRFFGVPMQFVVSQLPCVPAYWVSVPSDSLRRNEEIRVHCRSKRSLPRSVSSTV